FRQRLAEPGHIAMTEDGEDAGEEWPLLAVDLRPLLGEISSQSLGHGHSRHESPDAALGLEARRAAGRMPRRPPRPREAPIIGGDLLDRSLILHPPREPGFRGRPEDAAADGEALADGMPGRRGERAG